MPPKRQFRTDLLPQLAVYRFGNFSQEDWKRVRQTADGHRLPVYQLASLEQELIERFGERAQEMTHLRGAYLDRFQLVQRVLAAYVEVNRIYIPALGPKIDLMPQTPFSPTRYPSCMQVVRAYGRQ